jgi:hypothetical protein
MTRPLATTVTGQLIGRWISDLAMSILPNDGRHWKKGVAVEIEVGGWDQLTDTQRERLTEIGYDLLVRLAPLLAANLDRLQAMPAVTRDYMGRRIGTPGGVPGAAPLCACGSPTTLGVVHSVEGCWAPPPVVEGATPVGAP